jgi:hypothetical protein
MKQLIPNERAIRALTRRHSLKNEKSLASRILTSRPRRHVPCVPDYFTSARDYYS